MYRRTFLDKSYHFVSLLFVFIFFFVIEWRWEVMLLGFPDVKPYVAAAVMSIAVNVLGIMQSGNKSCKPSVLYWLIFFLLCYFIAVSALNINDLLTTTDYKMTEFGIWCINLALFITASGTYVWDYVHHNKRVMIVLYALFVLPLFFLLFYSGVAAQSNFNLRIAIWLSGLAGNSDYGVSYQSIGDKLAILTFVVLSLNIRSWHKIIVVVITVATLYIVGSKASLVGCLFAFTAYYILSLFARKHYIKCIVILLTSFCLLCGGLLYVVGNPSLQNSNNWLIRTVAQGQEDISVSGRHIIEEANQKTRDSRLVLGDYKFDYKFGRPGSYTHSAVGLIDYYGLPIFVISVSLWLYLLCNLIWLFTIGNKSPIIVASLMSILFYTLLFTIARLPSQNYLTYWVLGMVVYATYAPQHKKVH